MVVEIALALSISPAATGAVPRAGGIKKAEQ